MEVRDIIQETGIKTIPVEKKCKKAKWLSEEALQRAVKRRKAMMNRDSILKKQRYYFDNKGPSSQSNGFSSSHVVMYGYKSWTMF